MLFLLYMRVTASEIYTLSLHDALPISLNGEKGPGSFLEAAAAEKGARPLFDAGFEQILHPKPGDRKSTRLNSSHTVISYAVFCLKKKKNGSRIIAGRS